MADTALFTLIITFANGSDFECGWSRYSDVQYAFRHSLSYTSGLIKRVEVRDHYGSVRAIWDASWDDASKTAGLMMS